MAKENTTRLIIYIIGGALLVLAWGIAFGAIKSDVKHAVKDIQTNTSGIEAVETRQEADGKLLVRIDTRQEVMIKSLDELNKKLP